MKKRAVFLIFIGIFVSGCTTTDKQLNEKVEQINDSLTICAVDTDLSTFLEKPLAEYRKRYPDVEIKIRSIAFDDLDSKKKEVAAELMAGDGADFYMNPEYVLDDIYKAQEAGAFEDLIPWLQKMEGFSEENYMDGTFDLYEHTDACYIFPTNVAVTVLAVYKDMEESLGIDIDSWSHSADLLDAIEKFYETYPTEQPFLDMDVYTNFLSGYGYNVSDGMKNAEILGMPVFHKDMELYKKQAYRNGKYVAEQGAMDYYSEKEKMYRGEIIHFGKKIDLDIREYILMGGEEKADLTYYYGADGTILLSALENYAISSNSANKENAFHLLEIILELQAENPEMISPSSNKEVSEEYLRQQKEKWMKEEVVIDGQVYTGLTDKTFQKLEKLLENGTTYLLQPYVKTHFMECMESYFTGKSEMEPCLEEFRDYLEIYYSE